MRENKEEIYTLFASKIMAGALKSGRNKQQETCLFSL
jgi:hypothetical protein